jgi:nitrate/nitrite transport system ATP-binding protein
MALIEFDGVSRSFGTGAARKEVLRDIHLAIEPGEFVAVVGYSGSGKTTLVSMAAGLLAPSAGSVRFRGAPVAGPGPERGVVFQNYSLLPWLTVEENIALAVDQVHAGWDAARRAEQVNRYVTMVGLAHARTRRPSELSGGMRQRVSVARALAMEPEVLLLDEPLGALDALTRGTLQDEILTIWERDRRTVLLITNDVDEGLLMADRIVPLTAGPGATLGPAFVVDMPRPRRRDAVVHEARFKQLRGEIVGFLLGEGGRPKRQASLRLRLPDLLPEDLSRPRRPYGARPMRRGEERRETVETLG